MNELKFPLDFTNCPNCNSDRRLSNIILEQEKEKGKMPKESQAFLFTHTSIIAHPNGRWLTAPALITFYDACVDCGTMYCVHAELGTATPGAGPQAPKANIPFSTS